jgi:hypothetical protein
MKSIHHSFIALLTLLICVTGCSTARQGSDPFSVTQAEADAMAEGALRSFQHRAARIKQIDPRFAVHIPYLQLTNATLDVTLSELNAAWVKELGTKELPVVIKIDYRPAGEPPYEGYPGLRESITLTAHDLTVAELLVIVADISPHRLKIMGNTPTLECRHWIEEDWVTSIMPVSPTGRRFLGLTDSAISTDLSARLRLYGIKFPDGHGFYAKWNPEIEKLIIFNYPEQIDRLQAILTLVDEGFDIRGRTAQQPAAQVQSEGAPSD